MRVALRFLENPQAAMSSHCGRGRPRRHPLEVHLPRINVIFSNCSSRWRVLAEPAGNPQRVDV